MAENSKIEWTHHTLNPWIGCQKVGPGCDHCYAETFDKRFGGTRWGAHADRTRTSAANWRKPLAWDRAAAKAGERHRVFCASLADVFDNHASVLPEWRDDLFGLIRATPNLDWMLLTKRPGNIAKMLPADWGAGYPNVWLGCTVVNQDEADRDIPKLLEVPARIRFLSMEPLLGPVTLVDRDPIKLATGVDAKPEHRVYVSLLRGWGMGPYRKRGLDLVIVGGESGPKARPMHPDWARSLRDQCNAADVAFHFKQWGEWKPLNQTALGADDAYYFPAPETNPDASRRCKYDSLCLAPDGTSYPMGYANKYHRIADGAFAGHGHMSCFRVGKANAGRMLDGRTWDQMPEVRNG